MPHDDHTRRRHGQAICLKFRANRLRARPGTGRIDALAGPPYKPHATANGDRTREADLPTQQAGAQTPSWLSPSPEDQGWPQGACRPPSTRPQAAQRLEGGAGRRVIHGAAPATRGLSGRRGRIKGSRQRIRASGDQSAQGWTGAGGIYRLQEGRQLCRTQSRATPVARGGSALAADTDAPRLRLRADRPAGRPRSAV